MDAESRRKIEMGFARWSSAAPIRTPTRGTAAAAAKLEQLVERAGAARSRAAGRIRRSARRRGAEATSCGRPC